MKTGITFITAFIFLSVFNPESKAQKGSIDPFATASIASSHAAHIGDLNDLIEDPNAAQQVLKYLTKNLMDNENIIWTKLDENIVANVKDDNSKTKLLFNRWGRLIYRIDFIKQKDLDKSVLKLVNDSYWNYDITSVAHVWEKGREVYLVNLEGKKDYVTAVVENGDINEQKHYYKQDPNFN